MGRTIQILTSKNKVHAVNPGTRTGCIKCSSKKCTSCKSKSKPCSECHAVHVMMQAGHIPCYDRRYRKLPSGVGEDCNLCTT